MKKIFTGSLLGWCRVLLTSLPLLLSAQASIGGPISLEGDWKGSLTVPGGSLPISITVTELTNGTRFAVLDVPAQRISRAIMTVDVKADTLIFETRELGCSYTCVRTPDGKQVQGKWKQQGYQTTLALNFFPPPASPPKNFKFPPPYRVEDVVLTSPRDKTSLSGTLTIPPGEGPFPAAVLLSDMGPHDRDVSLGEYKLFNALADYLTRRGVAVLRLDDRGVGQSAGSLTALTTADLVKDAQAALSFLRTRSLIDFSQLGLIGHGEGGNIALLAAAQPLPPNFVIALAASGSVGDELLLHQPGVFLQAGEADTMQENRARQLLKLQQELDLKATELRAKGANAAQIETYMTQQQARLRAADKKRQEAIIKQQKTLLEVIRQTPDNAQAQAMLTNMISQLNRSLPLEAAQTRAAQMTSPWYRSYMAFNPQPELSRVTTAVLLLHGTDDTQVNLSNLTLLEKGLKANKRVQAIRLEGINHLFQAPIMEWPVISGEPKPIVAPAVQQDILAFIRQTFAQ
ncbi:alpha/beta fold hydrolase [Hymenobacter sp. BT188]|uniref:alpha/beta hydrolase family protein n=1 Tax=Hymenobacter sp. BT188 TaxID=2763504 RepID=UPI001650DAF4|nr:alpha/beta fold hydrolase [Hymenobacter sp. BT188]MBC6607738.1 alpha/beta fold hydrolase [Hymenobacter sp. BT188]